MNRWDQYSDEEISKIQLSDDEITKLSDDEVDQLKRRFGQLRKKHVIEKNYIRIWMKLRYTEADIAVEKAHDTLSERESWLLQYNARKTENPHITDEELNEVFRLLKQPFSLIRERLGELISTRHWHWSNSVVLYDIEHMTFPVSREDGKLVSEIMKGQQEHYNTTIKPYEGMPSQWDDEFDYDDCTDNRTPWEKICGWFRWKYCILSAHFRKPWPPPGIELRPSGSIFDQSPDALLQLRFKWGHWSNRIGTNPDLDFVPMKPLEHFRFAINGEFKCYSLYHPSTGNYPWCHLIPVLENPTGNDADWRFKDGCVFEYCLKGESKDSPRSIISYLITKAR